MSEYRSSEISHSELLYSVTRFTLLERRLNG